METTPDKHCKWKVTVDYLEEALGQIHKHGSTVTAIVVYEIEWAPQSRHKALSYLIIYYNPPAHVVPGIGGSGDSATIQ